MKYHEKLHLFFKAKNLSNKEVAEKMEVSPTMIGRYFMGTAEFSSVFIRKLMIEFPEIDLKYMFSEEKDRAEGLDVCEEPPEAYRMESEEMIDELASIEKKLSIIRAELARKRPIK